MQTPPGTQFISSYIEARGSDDPDYKASVFFGLQMFIKEYLLNPITIEDVDEAKEIIEAHGLPFNYDGWKYIVDEYAGMLPITIEAVPEGTVVALRNVLVQVRNTDPFVPWLTSFIETALLRGIWYPTTVATNSWTIKQYIKEYAEKTGSDIDVSFKLHDFGARGVSSGESAGIGGVSHLVNFMGTDTVEALVYARRYYNSDMAGFSIPASEHSTMTVWGTDNEVGAYRNMLKQFAKPGKMVAIVSDSYDIYWAVDKIWGGELKQDLIDSGATIIIRPDSGDPEWVPINVIEILMERFGFTYNKAGFKVLPSCIRVIQGDGINKKSIKNILINMYDNDIAIDNIAFGMGGALLQGINRDTLQFAMKANSITINGVEQDVYKKPVTDDSKSSKAGIQDLVELGGGLYQTVRKSTDSAQYSALRTVFKDGKLLVDESLDEIRKRSNA